MLLQEIHPGDLRLWVRIWFLGFRGGVGPLHISNSVPNLPLNPKNQILTRIHKIWCWEFQNYWGSQFTATLVDHIASTWFAKCIHVCQCKSSAQIKEATTSSASCSWVKVSQGQASHCYNMQNVKYCVFVLHPSLQSLHGCHGYQSTHSHRNCFHNLPDANKSHPTCFFYFCMG